MTSGGLGFLKRIYARWLHAVWPLGLTVGIAFLFFGRVLLGGEIYYSGDSARQYLPQRIVLDRALAQHSLPWWTADLGAGYPLLAEGEVGALYPPNWLLHMLPSEVALSVFVLGHCLLAGVGLYAFVRGLGLSRPAAYLGGIVFALGGFAAAHLSHAPILGATAWMPWMLALTHGLGTRDPSHPPARGIWLALALAIVVALQFLAGHAQVSLLSLMAVGAYALFLAISVGRRDLDRPPERDHPRWPSWAMPRSYRDVLTWLGAVLLGALLALPQLLPEQELVATSQRAGGVESAFFTSFSFHPWLLLTYISPFALGNPYPQGSVELMGYVGLLPLGLSSVALWRGRRREKWFFTALALAGVFLALGRWNPLSRGLLHVPLLNLFRAPSRYLYWSSLGLAVLAALGLDELCSPKDAGTILARSQYARWAALAVVALVLVISAAMVRSASVRAADASAQLAGGSLNSAGGGADALVAMWRRLPALFAVALVALCLAAVCDPARRSVVWLALAMTFLLVDLYAYHAVLDLTYNTTVPREQVVRLPESLSFLRRDRGLYRLYTQEDIVPALSVMRASFYPNLALTYGMASANIYMPLVPRSYGDYLRRLTAERLNRLNVKYYLIPQVLPVDAASELYDVRNSLATLPTNTWLELPPMELTGLEIESYLSHAAQLRDGEVAAELVLRDETGAEEVIPLRAGLETAEWAYERDDVRALVAHSFPEVASTWPARSGFPPREHPGHTYRARITLPISLRLAAVLLRPVLPEAFVRVERVRLRESSGRPQLLAHLVGLGDHTIVYRSEDVLIYRNEDVLPRAYIVPPDAVHQEGNNLTLPEALISEDVGSVQVVQYEDARVTLRASLEAPGYLILADLYYPGWRATVNGAVVPVLRADGVFRALALPAGEHEILFVYRPTWP